MDFDDRPPRTEVPGAPASEPADHFIQSLEYVEPLGRGGMSEVLRVRDPWLHRTVALKIIHPDLVDPLDGERFLAEAQIVAQLQHPGVVPVYALGHMSDGRAAYAMQEVHGSTLSQVIAEVHAAAGGGEWRPTASGWTLRRLVAALHRASEVVAYAHSRGVIHRDLKPQNIMVGSFGEVFVLDWGLARVLGGEARPITLRTARDSDGHAMTEYGSLNGTPAYMPPEQARGALDELGPASDVFSLGAVLFEILTGGPPYRGANVFKVLAAALNGSRAPMVGPAPLPDELMEIGRRALALDPAARPADAGRLAALLNDWLDGVLRREQALEVLARADALLPELAARRAEAESATSAAVALLEPLKTYSPVDEKLPAWELEDAAARLRREAELGEVDYLQLLHSALHLVPDLPEAHARLADHYRLEQERAEARRDEGAAARAEVLLRAHDRGRHAAWLTGDGALDLVTDPPGAAVTLFRYERVRRRLEPVFERELGRTPLREVRLGRGSWLLQLQAEGRAPVRYPVWMERAGRWTGARPGGADPEPVYLPRLDELGPDDVYVPGGPCWVGGDPEAGDAQPRAWLWIDGFVMRRFPVTFGEYLEFLDALVEQGAADEAAARVPRRAGIEAMPMASREEGGRWRLGVSVRGLPIQPDWPVSNVSAHDASAFAAWRAGRDGLPWRLGHELEREKAGRGVDGRSFPWGDAFDATWACIMGSFEGTPQPRSTRDFPADESVYGVRGLAGGISDWCCNAYRRAGWREGDPLVMDPAPGIGGMRAIRGGWWGGLHKQSRQASRVAGAPEATYDSVGLRLVRRGLGVATRR